MRVQSVFLLLNLVTACTESHPILLTSRRDVGGRDGGGTRPDAGAAPDGGPCHLVGESLVRHDVLGPLDDTWNIPDVTMECPTIASDIEARFTRIVLCNAGLAARFDVVVEGDGSPTELDSPLLFYYDELYDFTDCLDFDDGTGRSDARVNVRMGSDGFDHVIVSRRVPPTAPAGFTLTVTRVP
jgi:hypothetical protein